MEKKLVARVPSLAEARLAKKYLERHGIFALFDFEVLGLCQYSHQTLREGVGLMVEIVDWAAAYELMERAKTQTGGSVSVSAYQRDRDTARNRMAFNPSL